MCVISTQNLSARILIVKITAAMHQRTSDALKQQQHILKNGEFMYTLHFSQGQKQLNEYYYNPHPLVDDAKKIDTLNDNLIPQPSHYHKHFQSNSIQFNCCLLALYRGLVTW